MKHSFLSRLMGGLSLVSLALCLAAALLFFLGRITESTYKRGFLLASISWFVLATGRKLGRRTGGALLLLVVTSLILPAGCRREAASPKETKMITVWQSSVDLGDPHICSDSVNRLSLVFSVYEALVKSDAAGAYRPSLAERWSVDADVRAWTFTIREGVRFHDGTSDLRPDGCLLMGTFPE